MEELMKQALSEALQQVTDGDESHPVDLATDDTDTPVTITEGETIQIIKKEPNEKPLFLKDFVSKSATAEEVEPEVEHLEIEHNCEPGHRYSLRRSSKTQNQPDIGNNKGDSTDPQSLVELALPTFTQYVPATVPDMTMPETDPPVDETQNEPVRMDLEAVYQETLIDKKLTFTTKDAYYTSVECKSCQITFNDNYGFRRHLNHVHQRPFGLIQADNEIISPQETGSGRLLRSSLKTTPFSKKTPKCNVKFKRQYRASLKLKHLKTISLPEEYKKPTVNIQCRFCKHGGWKDYEYRIHLVQRHSKELSPLSKQIKDSNNERLKEAEANSSSTTSASSTSAMPPNASNDSPTTTDPDVTILDIPYDPIKDISENQRRTYQFFQTYMLDIS
ncbi:hypothetical protein HMPREF1544_05225 [Mucor circinelloides 1006PhL]|uniref:C2H2-type domain-containing protein n=1 Tax=Mucor circinelloides f. circinelloides (strain 1006PhL) TaxID=1220926 RepID=S2JDQ8_MUCC1|nr:hypothetical protein HMPREF1544_05225 [Mucor circinelloides 1006PhL]